MTDKTVLYIEDNFHNRRIVRKILTVHGYSVVEAEDLGARSVLIIPQIAASRCKLILAIFNSYLVLGFGFKMLIGQKHYFFYNTENID